MVLLMQTLMMVMLRTQMVMIITKVRIMLEWRRQTQLFLAETTDKLRCSRPLHLDGVRDNLDVFGCQPLRPIEMFYAARLEGVAYIISTLALALAPTTS